MKRIAPSALCTFFAAALLGLAGCDTGSGIEPGIPKDTTPAIDVSKMADMTKSAGIGGTGMPKEPPKADAPKDAEKK
jgi:hypothetical protein